MRLPRLARVGAVAAACTLFVSVPSHAQSTMSSIEPARGGADAQADVTEFGLPAADNVIIRKSERRLYLMRRGQVLRTYPVALGLAPKGHKEQEGDFRTPEGRYRLIRRNPRSDYFLSIEVSYPSVADVEHAAQLGVNPGGAIMIHGLPNTPRKPLDYYRTNDWTDGCIAVSNSDMVEIWMMTPLNTPIEIHP